MSAFASALCVTRFAGPERRDICDRLRAWGTEAALTLCLLIAGANAQTRGPELHAAFAGSSHRGGTPAIAWLCEQFLPSLPAWPNGLDPREPFALRLTANELSMRPTDTPIPDGVVALGTFALAAERGSQLLWRCDANGSEQWYVPADFALPTHWQKLLRAIEADVLDTPRSISAPVVAGHLAGGLLEGDPRATALRLGAAQCADVTWMAWRQRDQVRVQGRSDGGLMLPLVLLAMAIADGGGEPAALALRAFAARDGDQSEAARQLGRADRDLDVDTLRALLFAPDRVRLTAIDALVRRQASAELPNIVAAADGEHPWAELAAEDALRELWPLAQPEHRQRTRAALQKSQSVTLRGIDIESLPGGHAAPGTHEPTVTELARSSRAAFLMILFCTSIGLVGLWTRERVRLHLARA